MNTAPAIAETARMKRRLLKIRCMDWDSIAINNRDHKVFHVYRDDDASAVIQAFFMDPDRKPVTFCYGEEVIENGIARIELERDAELHPGNWPGGW